MLFAEENHTEADLQYVRSQIYGKQTGLAMVRGVTKNGRGPIFMPPIFVTVSLLESSVAADRVVKQANFRYARPI